MLLDMRTNNNILLWEIKIKLKIVEKDKSLCYYVKGTKNTHAVGAGRRVQVKLMEACVENSRGHNKNKMEEIKNV